MKMLKFSVTLRTSASWWFSRLFA